MTHPIKLLAADIGATHSRLVCIDRTGPGPGREHYFQKHYRNDRFDDCDQLLADFAEASRQAGITLNRACACFAIAGPIDGREARMSNRPWKLEADRIAGHLGLQSIILVNDFYAAATGAVATDINDYLGLQTGKPRNDAPRLVIGPGTGLGVALILPDGRVYPSEGGHIGFAPQDPWQRSLLAHLAENPGPRQTPFGPPPVRVNVERVVSGSGLDEIYRFICHDKNKEARLADSRQIIAAAASGDATAHEAVQRFAAIFGAVCGDLALVFLSAAGVLLVGSVANSLRPWLEGEASPFLEAFNAKAEHRHLVHAMPVNLITAEEVGLTGALMCAERSAAARS